MIQTILQADGARKASLLRFIQLLPVLLLLTVATAQAQKVWTGGAGTDWNNPDNWIGGVPGANDDAQIQISTNTPVIGAGTHVAVKSVYLLRGTLVIDATASLTVDGSRSYTFPDITTAFYNVEGNVSNYGELIVGNTVEPGAHGIVNTGTFRNYAGAIIRIDRSTDTGLYSRSGSFTNEGSLNIGQSSAVGFNGIWNDGNFKNLAGGTIRIDRSSLRGITTNSNHFENSGTITVGENADVGEFGFENRSDDTRFYACGIVRLLRGGFSHKFTGGFVNAGFMEIAGSITKVGNFNNSGAMKYNGNVSSITNDGIIVRDTPGAIFLYRSGFTGIIQGIFKDAAATVSAGTYTPRSTFIPDETYNTPTTLYASLTNLYQNCAFIVPFLYSTQGGLPDLNVLGNWVDIANGSTTASTADHTDFGDQYYGAGTVTREFAIQNRNTRPLSLTGTTPVTISGSADFTVTILPATTIQGDASTTLGITFDPAAIGVQTATVSIASDDADENPYTFTIRGTGISSCSTATAAGVLTWTGAADANWFNACNWSPAALPSADNDIVIVNGPHQPTLADGVTSVVKTVEIQAGATLTVNNTASLTLTGLKSVSGTDVALFNAGTLQHNGEVAISAATGEGLRNEGSIIIANCAKLTIAKASVNNLAAGTITNNGLLSPGGSVANAGALTNNGILHYATISTPATNNQIVIGDKQTPIFTYASEASWQVQGIFTDAAATQSAGTFNAPNSFVPGGVLAEGDNDVFAKISDGSCVYVVPFVYQKVTGLSTWTGVASSDWNNAANWTPGLPDGNANIVIPDVSTHDPVIGTGLAVAANSVLVETGASLEISAGGSLALNGFAPYSEPFTFNFTTALNNKGSIVNSGQLTIGDLGGAGSYGIVNQGNLETKTGSVIRVDRSTDTGLFNAFGTLTNAGDITIGGNAAVGLHGIWNDAVFNHNGGEIRIDRSSARALVNNADETKSIHATFTNAAAIVIGAVAGVGTHGVENLSVFNHQSGASLEVSRADENAIYHASGTFTNAGSITLGAGASAGVTGLNTWADFVNSGRITADNFTGHAVHHMSGTFRNSGEIVVGHNAGGKIGIENNDVFNNEAGGSIKIDRTSEQAFLHSAGSLSNTGEIVIGSEAAVGTYGFSTQANADNNAGGVIRVDRTTKRGTTHGAGVFNNAGTIAVGQIAASGVSGVVSFPTIIVGPAVKFNNLASGVILVDRATESGLANYYAEFVNAGSIVVGAQDLQDRMMDYGIDGGNIRNTASGHIRIDRAGKIGFRHTGSNTNEGKITIGGLDAPMGKDGLTLLGGTFNNMPGAELVIDRTPDVGLNVSFGRFNNSSTVTVGRNAGVGTYAVVVQGVFSNAAGSVNIGHSASYGIWIHPSGLFDNSSVVTIGADTNAAPYGFFVRGQLKNNASGVVKIDRTTENGLLNFDGSVTNDGELTIGSVAGPGTYGLVNRAAFQNNAGGKLNIDRASDTGLYNYSIAKFDNAGAIRVGANEAIGVHGIFNEAEFNNNAGGSIRIDRTSLAALRNFKGTFTNAADITIGSVTNAGTYGIRNQAAFTNNAGGVIKVDRVEQGIFAEDNTFNNVGGITIGQVSPIQTLITQQGSGAFANSTDGILKGTGQIAAAGFSNAGGTLSPGYSPGVMTFDGNQDFNNGTMDIEVNGIGTPGIHFDQIVVNGTATLGGTLKVTSTYTPAINEEVVILSATAISGEFASVTGIGSLWKVVYTPNAVKLAYIDPMPVKLVDFTAQAEGSVVQLAWETATETDNAGFHIEHSLNGLQWKEVGFVDGSGTSTVTHTYSFLDTEPKPGLNYYRLRQVDFDGTTEYSRIKAARIEASNADVTVWADVARQAHVRSEEVVERVIVYSLSGRVVATSTATTFDLSQAPAGMLVVQVWTSTGVVTRKLFLM